ncbi:hypothetical protein QWY79_02490 [Halomonas sabkhae]|uniref:hypothetical protein n=1 Tax=Halomonas sabkhae TaxID=626223 RepID=UPI0025B53C0C|nr:hypothetical protein [Halomonas sabkhae]MDN3524130.1 hypothetical protein [Halomonas sabkhae]
MPRLFPTIAGFLMGISTISGTHAQNEMITVEVDGDTRVGFSAEWRLTDSDGHEEVSTFQGEAPRTFHFTGTQLEASLQKDGSAETLSVMIKKGGNTNRHSIGRADGRLHVRVR